LAEELSSGEDYKLFPNDKELLPTKLLEASWQHKIRPEITFTLTHSMPF